MELLSNAPAHASVFPPEKRAAMQLDGQSLHDDGVSLPVVDLHRAALAGDDGLRRRVAAEIVRAGKEFGFFQARNAHLASSTLHFTLLDFEVQIRAQVVNLGVGEDLVSGFREAAAEFFAMPAEEKLPYCSNDQSKPFLLASSTTYDKSETRYWRDYIKLQCHPVTDELVHHWPAEPTSFRTCLAKFSEEVHELAQTLLGLVAEGLGLSADFFAGVLSSGETQMNVNYYPPCPDPSLTLGLLPHCDRHLLTVLSQGDVAGLQAKHDGNPPSSPPSSPAAIRRRRPRLPQPAVLACPELACPELAAAALLVAAIAALLAAAATAGKLSCPPSIVGSRGRRQAPHAPHRRQAPHAPPLSPPSSPPSSPAAIRRRRPRLPQPAVLACPELACPELAAAALLVAAIAALLAAAATAGKLSCPPSIVGSRGRRQAPHAPHRRQAPHAPPLSPPSSPPSSPAAIRRRRPRLPQPAVLACPELAAAALLAAAIAALLAAAATAGKLSCPPSIVGSRGRRQAPHAPHRRQAPHAPPLSVEHRAITNSGAARMSVATLIMPKTECRIGPAPEMVDEAMNPAKFRDFVFSEFMEAYNTAAASREDVLEYFKIHNN
ncbi:unnamed protein product [Alopecurus aequalis]